MGGIGEELVDEGMGYESIDAFVLSVRPQTSASELAACAATPVVERELEQLTLFWGFHLYLDKLFERWQAAHGYGAACDGAEQFETPPRWWKVPSALSEDSAPSASLGHLKARAAPTHPGAQPDEAWRGLRSSPQAAPNLRTCHFQPAGLPTKGRRRRRPPA